MPRRKSRIAENQRQYQGEEFTQPLINWLNQTPDTEGRDRVGTILSLYARLGGRRDFSEDVLSQEDFEEMLDERLRYFQLSPTIKFVEDHDSPGDWHGVTGWKPVPGSELAKNSKRATAQLKKAARESPELFFNDDGTAVAGMFMGEEEAIRLALRIIDTGWFWQVGPCTCGKIFFRRFRHQRFCSEKCRIAAFRSSDEARQKRNEYARELYHTKKALEEGKRR